MGGSTTTRGIAYVSKTEDYHLPASAFLCRKFGGHPTPATQTINLLRSQVKMFGLVVLLMIRSHQLIWGLHPMILQGFTMFRASQVVSHRFRGHAGAASHFGDFKVTTPSCHQLEWFECNLLRIPVSIMIITLHTLPLI